MQRTVPPAKCGYRFVVCPVQVCAASQCVRQCPREPANHALAGRSEVVALAVCGCAVVNGVRYAGHRQLGVVGKVGAGVPSVPALECSPTAAYAFTNSAQSLTGCVQN